MKCFFYCEFERAAKIRKIAVYCFLVSLLVPKNKGFIKEGWFQITKRQKKSIKSIKFVMSCAGHVDGMKKVNRQ